MGEEIIVTTSEPERVTEHPVELKDWARQVSQHLGRARQQIAELAAQQNALLIKAIDEGIDLVRTAPTPDLRQIANEGLEALSEAKQVVSTLAQLPPEQLLETAREVAQTQATQAVESATELAGAGAANLIEKGERWLEIIDQKNVKFIDTVKEDLQLDEKSAAAALANFSRELVSGYVDVQRKWMELAREVPFIKSHLVSEKGEPLAAIEGDQTEPPAGNN